ncbi:DUF7504 family protein [Halocatena marina]|uniref:DUF7504 family protein n=1 Tax=Halocatena marina TaxID=2934937 RepID=UPI002224684E|nr:HalOD1 output domain-containing protein [Halocatena marina]
MSPNSTDTEPHVDPDPISRTLQLTLGSDQSLSTEIVMGVARASEVDPTQLHQALHEVINPSALDALFQPKADGTKRPHGTVCFSFHGYHVSAKADGTITLLSEFDRLKQQGVNLLVCGTVPDAIRDELSTRLLGDAGRDRTALFALSDRPMQTAIHRLSDAQIPQQRAHVISTGDSARSAAAQTNTTQTDLELSRVSGSLEDVQAAILQTLSDLEHHNETFEPADLRFCFDSLRPFVDRADPDQITTSLTQICNAIKQRDGMGQFQLPYAFDSSQVQNVRQSFEIVVEMRVSEHGPEYRWHLQTSNFTTRWMPL